MARKKTLHIGMSLSPTWLSGDAWRRSDSNTAGIFGSDFYIDVTKRSEAAKLDFVFRADALFIDTAVLEQSVGFSSLDPTLLLATLAHHTSHIGLLSTVSTTFWEPFTVARQILSLHWLSSGRAGWNVVTALAGNENFGLKDMPSAEQRYSRAEEFVDIAKKLWRSYPYESLHMNRETGVFADTSLIKSIDHTGEHFSVKGPLTLPDCQGIDIPLIQAGASHHGRNFAAQISDAIFAATPDMAVAVELRRDLQRRAVAQGRQPTNIRLLPGLHLFLADTQQEAEELFLDTHKRVTDQQRMANVKRIIGLDLSDWPMDKPVTLSDVPEQKTPARSQTHFDLLKGLIEREQPRVSDLLHRPEVMSSGHWQIIGTPETAAAEVARWADAGAIDGFIAVPGGSVGSLRMTLEELVPRLTERGLFRKEYSGKTFAGHLRDSL